MKMIKKIVTLLCIAVLLIANSITTVSALSETNSTESGDLVGDDIILNTDDGLYMVIIGQTQQIIAYDQERNEIDISNGKAEYTITKFLGTDNGIEISEDGIITANAGGLFRVEINVEGYGSTGFGVQAYAEPTKLSFGDSKFYLEANGNPDAIFGQYIWAEPADAAYAPVDFKIMDRTVAGINDFVIKEELDDDLALYFQRPVLVGRNPGKTTLVAEYGGNVLASVDIETIEHTDENDVFQSPQESFDMLVGDTQQLTVYEHHDDYDYWEPRYFQFIDYDDTYVSVTDQGLVTALSDGQTDITGYCFVGSIDVPSPFTWHINIYDPTPGVEEITDIAIKNYGSPISLVQLQNTKSITFYPGETYVLTVERRTTGNIFTNSYDKIANGLIESGLCSSYTIDHSVQRNGGYYTEVNQYTFTVNEAYALPNYIHIPVNIDTVTLYFVWADVAERPTTVLWTTDDYDEDKLGNAETNCNMLLSSIEDKLMDAARGVVVSGDVLNTSNYVTINPVLKYDVKEYNLDDALSKTVTLDITPGYTLQFRNNPDPDEVPIHETEFQSLDLSDEADPLQMKIGVGAAFSEGETVYVYHNKADGRKYYYSGNVEIDEDTGEGCIYIDNPNGFSEFTLTNKEPKFVAEITDGAENVLGTKYESLQDAVDAAGSEETTIKLLSDSGDLEGDGVIVPSGANITFWLNGGVRYDVTGDLVGTANVKTSGFLICENSNVAFEDGSLWFNSTDATVGIQNYGNLTLNSVSFSRRVEGAEENKFCMISSGSGTVNIEGSTSFYANGRSAINVYADEDYPLPVININISEYANINGNIKVAGGQLNITSGNFYGEIITSDPYQAGDIAIRGGMFKYPVDPEHCSAGYIPFDTEAGELRYTVTNDPYAVDVFGCSLSLNGDIGVNYYLIIPEEIRNTVEFHFSYQNKAVDYTIAQGDPINDPDIDDLYKFTVRVSAKEMRDQITLTVAEPYKLVSTTFNEDYTQNGNVYSVSAYFGPGKEYAKAHQNRYPHLEELIDALDNYGRYAQKYFEYGDYTHLETDTKAIQKIDVNELSFFRTYTEGDLPEGITYEGSNLILKTVTTYQMFFSIADGYDINDYTFTASNGDEYELVPVRGSLYKIVFPDISAKNLSDRMDVYVQKRNIEGYGRITASPLTYIYDVLCDENTSDTLKDLCRALYNYAFAAYQHFYPVNSGDQPIG